MKNERKMVHCTPIVWLALMTIGALVLLGCDSDVTSPNPDVLPAGTPQSLTSGVSLSLESSPLNVSIDIKPGSDPNCFNINGNGVIPVAILGSATFDVTQIDIGTLLFGGLEVRVKGNGNPQCSNDDVNGDGSVDLVCQFVDDTSRWMTGNGTAWLEGNLLAEFGGTEFSGSGDICVRP